MGRPLLLCPSAAAAAERAAEVVLPGGAVGGELAQGLQAFAAGLARPGEVTPPALRPFLAHAAAVRSGLRLGPGAASGLARALSELHGSGVTPEALARVLAGPQGQGPPGLAACFRAHLELLRTLAWLDPGELPAAAAKAVAATGSPAPALELGELTVELRAAFEQGELDLFAALAHSVPVRVELPFDERRPALFEPLEVVHQELLRVGRAEVASVDPASRASPALRPSLEGLFGGAPPAAAPPEAMRAWLLPTPEAEAREVVRAVRGLLHAGCPPDRIAVVGEEAPLREVARKLSRARIPSSGGAPLTLDASRPGLAALVYLDLVEGGPRREPLLHTLAAGLWPLGGRPGDRFRGRALARALREAGAGDHGAAELLPPLRAHLARREVKAPLPPWMREAAVAFEAGLGLLAALPAQATAPVHAAALWRTLRGLGVLDALGALPEGGGWRGAVAQAGAALALERLRVALSGLASLGSTGRLAWPRLRRSEFRIILQGALASEVVPAPRHCATGVLLATPSAFLGRSRDHLFRVGLASAERAAGGLDPFLPTGLRAAVCRDLERPAALAPGGRLAEARALRLRDYLVCCGARQSLTASGTRLDALGRSLEPSELLHEVARLCGGFEAMPTLSIVPRGAACLDRAEVVAAHGGDAAVRAAEPVLALDLLGARDREASRRRAIPLGLAVPSSGLCDAENLLAALGPTLAFPAARPLSPSLLSRLATCGFRALAGDLLSVRAPDDRGDQLGARDGGTLRHRCLKAAFEALHANGLLPLRGGERRAEELRVLLGAAREAMDAFAQEAPVGRSVVWAAERRSIERQLRGVYAREIEDAAGFVPTHFELAFGVRGGAGGRAPLTLSAPGGDVALGGKIDRIDLGLSGVRVLDYKTGALGPKEKRLSLGLCETELQLAVYALLARELCDGATGLDAAYLSITEAKLGKGIAEIGAKQGIDLGLFLSNDAGDRARCQREGLPNLAERVGELVGEARAGHFAVRPGDCGGCELVGACRVGSDYRRAE